jgi:hypothetical protein
MAYTFSTNNKEDISFEDFINKISNVINFGDENSLISCSDYLLKLANNSDFFINYLNTQLSDKNNKFQKNNSYSEQSYMLYDCNDFYVRMTFWPILSNNFKVLQSEKNLFSYDLAHDHNFPLLTVGYFGDGYSTKLWEYDYDNVIGYVNEKVEINFLEEVTLNKGKALYYRPSKDIHSQFPPKKNNSLAINIILKSYKQFDHRQYEFDIENKKIKKIIYGSASSKFGLLKLATLINNSKTIDLINEMSKSHKIAQVRQECLASLYEIEKSKDVWKIGLKDKDKSVYNLCKQKLDSTN